ncbi:hypothetical protein KGV55_01565 [Candidatus Gracilibacteria bacterium]|nr:hypothetical protein [Candidatus Gracilibacteria bacterium]
MANDVKYEGLAQFYEKNPKVFLEKTDYINVNKIILGLVAIACVVLIFKPDWLEYVLLFVKLGNFIPMIVAKIALGIIAAFLGFMAFFPYSRYILKESGEEVKQFKSKKFDLEGGQLFDKYIEAFENKDLETLYNAHATDSGSLELVIDYAPKSKKAYLLLINMYYGDVNYSSDVWEISGADYEKYFKMLKKM